MIELPHSVITLISRLEKAGFSAYAVGGCVRDSLLGRPVGDWDICTSARPEQMREVFSDLRVADTGADFGTLTVVLDGRPFELTTFRTDGTYTDHRRPDRVAFTAELAADLSRRDFTVNAMAFHPAHGLIDPFGGQSDLEAGLLKTVGEPEARFSEDALRILRGLRFLATLGLRAEEGTRDALLRLASLLGAISPERCMKELRRMVVGEHIGPVMLDYARVLEQIVPEIGPSIGFPQNNRHHIYDVWEHTAVSMRFAPPDEVVRLSLFFHDLGKPYTHTVDKFGESHFYHHGAASARLTREAMRRLRFDRKTATAVTFLVEHHDMPIPTSLSRLVRALNWMGPERFLLIMEIKRADNLAQSPRYQDRQAQIDTALALYREAREKDICFSLSQLALRGRDIPLPEGPEKGRLLQHLLNLVMDGKVANTKEALSRAAAEWIENGGQ